ncbi:hypothetical protein PQR19_13145 [Paraburkholderia strydomiana]|uniref:Uncharacterized protein n=1 Tax=Paraburkholderia strydomiana TaxID=1245417 RepID=A0ABW9C1I8_9BURK
MEWTWACASVDWQREGPQSISDWRRYCGRQDPGGQEGCCEESYDGEEGCSEKIREREGVGYECHAEEGDSQK